MKRYILTGAPGSGKTTLLRRLEAQGCFVVEEAATDVIAQEHANGVEEPWTYPAFIEKILDLQEQRQAQALSSPSDIQFFDRAPLDTLALSVHLGYPVSDVLRERFKAVQEAGRYERNVFFLENLGFCEPTAARRITYAETLRFEKVHEDVYSEWGYRLVKVPPVPIEERAQMVLAQAQTKTSIK